MARARALVAMATLAVTLCVSVLAGGRAVADIVVSVDPVAGLADGQPVTVSGTGFSPSEVVAALQCSAAAAQSRAAKDCDLTTARTSPTDATGAATIVIEVKRTIDTANGTVDCATAATPCLVAMSAISNGTRSSGMNITFDPNAPPVPVPNV